MKRVLLFIFPLLLLPVSLKAVIDPNTNRMGIYFDTNADSNCLIIPVNVPFLVFVMITNPSADEIHGVEFGYEIVVPEGYEDNIFRLANNLPSGAVDLGNSENPLLGDYRYSLDSPLPSSVVVTAISWQFMLLAPMPVDLFLKPANPESIPDGLPSYDNGTCHQRLDLSLGSDIVPAATVNGDCVHYGGRCRYDTPSHSPLFPTGSQDIEIALPFYRSYTGWDCGGGGPAMLFFRYHFPGASADYDSIPMVGDDPGEDNFWYFRGVIPGSATADSVEYFVSAEDPHLSVPVTFPAPFCGGVNDGFIIEVDQVSDVPLSDPMMTFNLTCQPNPFNPMTVFHFEMPRSRRAWLRVYDPAGRLVRRLIDGEEMGPGGGEAYWDGRSDAGRRLAAGVYFGVLEAGGKREVVRAVMVK